MYLKKRIKNINKFITKPIEIQKEVFNYLIKNGTIIDGSGDNRYEADILISDDQIVSILSKGQKTVKINDENYNLNDLSFNNIIDATSLIIAPGFIDVHTHDDQNIFIDRIE